MHQLMVYSKSTEKYIGEFEFKEKLLVIEPPNKDTLKNQNKYDDVIAIGVGSVIDTAKILCKNVIEAVPTTYAGATETSHAVYWDGDKKCSNKTKKAKAILKPEWINLSKEVEMASKIDCICHIMESLISPNSNFNSTMICGQAIELIKMGDWLQASILAGTVIEMVGTNIIHGLSYGLTTKYKLPHGVALSHILNLGKTYKKVEELL